MSRFRYTTPERLQFREGGGCLSLFGTPFFLAGVFMLLSVAGVVRINGGGPMARPLLALMGLAFTGVGSALLFGRAWAVLDRSERAAIKSWGLLVSFREYRRPLDEFTRVAIGFEAGDSDSSEKFPVTLKARGKADFVVCSPASYDEARACAAEAARHLGFTLEDASGDHAVTIDPADIDTPLQARTARDSRSVALPPVPAAARSEVHRETGGIRIVVPHRPANALGLALLAAPLAVPVLAGPTLWRFFQQTRTPEPIGLAFLAGLAFMFGVLPALTIVNGFVRSRFGHMEIRVSREGVTVRERRAWRTYTVATLAASDIFDVDYGTRHSSAVSASLAVEQQLLRSGHDVTAGSPRMERLAATTAKWTKGRGVIVKSRGGLTAFGADLDDDEIRYLHAVVRQALVCGGRL